MHRGQDVELQKLRTEENIGCGGERGLLDLPSAERDRQCHLRTRQKPSSSVNDTSAVSMVREDKTQSQKGIDDIRTGDVASLSRIREDIEKVNDQWMVEEDEWAMSRVGSTG